MKLPTRDQLVKRRAIVIADAQMKLECADWHGCADACMDSERSMRASRSLTKSEPSRTANHWRFEAEHLSDNPDRTYNI